MNAELAAKLKASKPTNQPPEKPQTPPSGPTADQRAAFLEAQVQTLQEQLRQKSKDDSETRLLEQAEKMKLERAKLEEEANLQKILSDTFGVKRTPNDDLSQLDPREMIEIMGNAVGKAVDAQSKLLEAKFQESSQAQQAELKATQRALMELMGTLTVKEARSQYTDFDEYGTDIKQILSTTSGLTPEQAYVLAKAQKSARQPVGPQVDSERPTVAPSMHSSENRNEREDEAKNLAPNRAFREAVYAAIDKTLAARSK